MEGERQTPQSVKAELSIFDDHTYQVTHLKGQWHDVKPSNQYQGVEGTPLEFDIPKAAGWYLDFNDSYLIMEVAIEKFDKKAWADTDDVAFVNFIAAALFKDISCIASEQKLEGENQLYGYKAYLYTLLTASLSAKQFQLGACGWAKDTAGKFDDPTNNKGYVIRKAWTAAGGTYQFLVPILLDVWMQQRYMMDEMDFRLILQLQDPRFVLQGPSTNTGMANYKINIKQATLCMRQVNVSPSVIKGHELGLNNQNAVYPFNGHRIYHYLIKADGYEFDHDNLCKGCYPKLLVLGLVDHEAFHGKPTLSPWNFQHFNVNEIGLQVNAHDIPHKPFKPNYAGKMIVREYMALFNALGKAGLINDDNGILLEDFIGGNALYAFILAPDMCLSGNAQPARLSPIALHIGFAVAIPKTLELVVFAVYDSKFEVSKARNVVLDPSQTAH